ncbi:MAG: nuclear transport factor 2 family protein [Pyrinomonadaceae bacterium]|nr:nuclear transport factor 2 family protein [Pyrinomonadaceae bacterium]
MKVHFIFVALLLATASVVFGPQSGRTQQELLRANQEYDDALVRGDAAALDLIYSDDFIYTTPDGDVRDKAQQLAFTRSGDLKLEVGRSDDVRVRLYGNTAVMTGRFRARGKFRDRNIDIRERYTALWVKSRGRWSLVAEQGNFIKQQ